MEEAKPILIEKRSSEILLRPRFRIDLLEPYDVVLNRFSEAFKNEETAFRGSIVDGHIFISVPKKEEHFWSPQLHLEIIEEDSEASLLKGLFGPKPQVWTLFMFVHFVIGTLFLGFAVMLIARMSLNESLFLPILMMVILPVIWVTMYFLGKIGKDTGKGQMKDLHEFMLLVIQH